MKKTVLFICNRNAGRSQMAEGILRHFHGDRFDAYSAGNDPAEINPLTILVMEEIGIDMSGQSSKGLDTLPEIPFDLVVTMCGSENFCPILPACRRQIHIPFPDPWGIKGTEDERCAGFRKARDEILGWIDETFR